MAIIFNGEVLAREKERAVHEAVQELPYTPRLLSVVFDEDPASQLYTQLKFEAAVRTGIEFDREDYSLLHDVPVVERAIRAACKRNDVHGVMIQKPTRSVWAEVRGVKANHAFESWWRRLTAALDPVKDVDCLTKSRLDEVYAVEWRLLPATVRAVLSILDEVLWGRHAVELTSELPLIQEFKEMTLTSRQGMIEEPLGGLGVAVVGRSEIVGRPLAAVLRQFGAAVTEIGKDTEGMVEKLRQADVVISATGKKKLIRADMVREGVVVIDVGSPGADVDFEAVKHKASFITPVPSGVGPMTVVSLLQNMVDLVRV